MITGLLLGCEPADAARLGTACGSLVATGLGSDAGITSLDDAIELPRRAGAANPIGGAHREAGVRHELT